LLQRRSGGPPVWPKLPAEILQANPAFLNDNATKTKGWYPSAAFEQSVRSVYLIQKRTVRLPWMETFNLPDNSVSCGRRETSIVAPQALSLMNGSLTEQASASLAELVISRSTGDGQPIEEWIETAYALAVQRAPTAAQRKLATHFFQSEAERDPTSHRTTLVHQCRVLMNTNAFAMVE
jgi:hypothetical protein